MLQKGGALQSRTIVTYQLTVEPILASTEYIRTEDCGVSQDGIQLTIAGRIAAVRQAEKRGTGLGLRSFTYGGTAAFSFKIRFWWF